MAPCDEDSLAPNADNDFPIHVGPGAIILDTAAVIKPGDEKIPGASVKIDPDVMLITESKLPMLAVVDVAHRRGSSHRGILLSWPITGKICLDSTVVSARVYYSGLLDSNDAPP